MYPRAGMSFVSGLWLYVLSALFFVTLIGRSFPFSLLYSGTFLAYLCETATLLDDGIASPPPHTYNDALFSPPFYRLFS